MPPVKRALTSASRAASIEWGGNTQTLVKGLAVLGPFFIAARAFTAGGQILAGRLLGPAEYGLVSLAIATAGFCAIPLQMGFIAGMLKFASMEGERERRDGILSTAFWLSLAWETLCCAGLYFLRTPMARVFHVPVVLYLWSLAYASILVFYMFVSSALQATKQFKERGRVEFVYGLSALALFLLAYEGLGKSYFSYVAAISGGLILSSTACVIHLRKWIKPSLSLEATRLILSYFIPPILVAVSTVMLQMSIPLILAAYLNAESVGFYGIYQLGTIGIAGVISQVLTAVLFPLSTAPERQRGAWRKFFFLSLPLFSFFLLSLLATQFAALHVVGKKYPIRPLWLLLFSAAGAVSILYSGAMTLLNARDVSGLWLGTCGNIISGLLTVLLSFSAIPKYGLAGAAAALAISYGAGLAWNCFWGWNGIRHAPARP